MPAKRRLVPPFRPNADGTGFVQAGRGGALARNRSSARRRCVVPTQSPTISTSSSAASSRSPSCAEAAVPPRGSLGDLKGRHETRAGTSAEYAKRYPQTSDTRRGGAAAQAFKHPARAPVPGAARTSMLSASLDAGAPPNEAKPRLPPPSAAGSVTIPHAADRKQPAGKTSDVALIVLAVGVDSALGPSECLVATRTMHRLGLQNGYIVHLSTSCGDVYAEVRQMRGSSTASDMMFVNDDAAGVLGDLSSVSLCPVLLPRYGVPTLRSVTLMMVVPEDTRGADVADGVVPSIASTVEWQALFRRTLHHKVGYVHLRVTQRVLTHRIALEVVDLSVLRQGEETSVAEFAAPWGIVTDATEVRLCCGGAAAEPSSDTRPHSWNPVANCTAERQEGGVVSSGFACTLVVGEAGVGKSRWLTSQSTTAAAAEQRGGTGGSASSGAASMPGRYTEWVHVDQLPQGEGSEVSTATVLREVFERVRQSAPATVIIDDLHLICAREASSAGSRWAMSLIAHALAAELLDLRTRRLEVRVMASAPTLASLDACLTGGTLFGGNVVTLEMPSGAQERLACLRTCLSELSLGGAAAAPAISEGCLVEVAERAHGFTQRDLHRLVETAVVRAFEVRQSMSPTEEDLRAASAAVCPSSLRRFEVSVPKVRWADIGGSAEAKQTLCDMVEWCLGRQRWVFTEFNLTPPKGVLLYGPPGCSKTMLAKALANESHMNFISVKGPEVFSKWVGDSEKAVRDIFGRARAASPCVVFIDELDGMCGHRGRGGVSDRVISQFLTELDGLPAAFEEKKNALVFVAATNRPDSIDGAVLRPGRIDRRVYVGLPTLPERCAIAEIQFRHLPVALELTADYVAGRTEGYTGAEVVAVVKEAAFHAITANAHASHVTVADVDAALQKVRPRISAKDVAWYKHWPHSNSDAAV
ncbi:hypothetical protein JKF63_03035 [Porcisia hertigi]|uniref:AAA+ ATPase domain-containing protein n=1 Tax=Porcisia hertigi TaxID=2761500 RepID=A0A836HEW7_9TRYP|nr:hypothetical protein JKF63_03035 [Porcisia hertigi]